MFPDEEWASLQTPAGILAGLTPRPRRGVIGGESAGDAERVERHGRGGLSGPTTTSR